MRLPASALLGKENKGFYYLMAELPQVRGVFAVCRKNTETTFVVARICVRVEMMCSEEPPGLRSSLSIGNVALILLHFN